MTQENTRKKVDYDNGKVSLEQLSAGDLLVVTGEDGVSRNQLVTRIQQPNFLDTMVGVEGLILRMYYTNVTGEFRVVAPAIIRKGDSSYDSLKQKLQEVGAWY